MGTLTINGKTYQTIEKTVPPMTKEQMEHYTEQVGGFGPIKSENPEEKQNPERNDEK
ncbi:MAG: hypothetical protein ACI4XF_04785 [Oscillospiraceae bacterium]